MRHNQPLASYYPKDDSFFLDPLYVPYQTKMIPINVGNSDKQCHLGINTWVKAPCKGQIDPSTVRMGWNQDFLNVHSDFPCPSGFGKLKNGFCTRLYQEGHESNFYKKEGFTVQYQYNDGYTVNQDNTELMNNLKKLDTAKDFQHRSVNPFTGHYVEYARPKMNTRLERYGVAPTRFSYLGK